MNGYNQLNKVFERRRGLIRRPRFCQWRLATMLLTTSGLSEVCYGTNAGNDFAYYRRLWHFPTVAASYTRDAVLKSGRRRLLSRVLAMQRCILVLTGTMDSNLKLPLLVWKYWDWPITLQERLPALPMSQFQLWAGNISRL